jgi:MoaA/NifB/PqqE/SkfB family radical SAM enzyme
MTSRERHFLAFQIQITSRCNLRCPICTKNVFSSEWIDGDMDMGTYEALSRAFPYLKQAYLDAWGEPLLHPNFWEMVSIAREAGCSVGTTTNGTLINRDVARRLAAGLDVVGISMDGATAGTYESIRRGAKFDQVVEGVRELVAAKKEMRSDGYPLVSLLFLKNRRNIRELPDVVALAAELGADEVVASNLTYVAKPAHEALRVYSLQGASPETLAILDQARIRARNLGLGLRIYPLEPKRVAFCEARPLEALHITWDGFVSPCVYLTLPIKSDTMAKVYEGVGYQVPMTRLGNVNASELIDIWNSEAYKRFREPFAMRNTICGKAPFGMNDDGGFDEVDVEIFRSLSRYALPDVCRGCYKALGI